MTTENDIEKSQKEEIEENANFKKYICDRR